MSRVGADHRVRPRIECPPSCGRTQTRIEPLAIATVDLVHSGRGSKIGLITARVPNRKERRAFYEHLEETA